MPISIFNKSSQAKDATYVLCYNMDIILHVEYEEYIYSTVYPQPL